MGYYKIRAKSFDTTREVWLVVKADSIYTAMRKADEQCTLTEHIFYPLEQTLHEITEQEYLTEMKKMPKPGRAE